MGLRDDLYKDIDKLYQNKLARIHFLKQKSLEAIRTGRVPEGLDDRSKDVIRWILEDREMRLRRKRDLAVLYSEWQKDRDERRSELDTLLDEFVREREQTRANWRRVQARYTHGKRQVDSMMGGIAPGPAPQSIEEEPSPGSEEGKKRGWQIGERG